MIEDFAPFRNTFSHTPHDTPNMVDFDKIARVVEGLAAVVAGPLAA